MQKELEIAIQAAKAAGEIAMVYYRSSYDIHEKSPNNPVTTADLMVNQRIREIICHAFPDDGWLSEETEDSPDRLTKSRVWIVDPIDGTEEFIAGIPEFAISIALVVEGTPVIGVLYNPATAELFYAYTGGGAFCDGTPIRCSTCRTLKQASMLVSQTEHRRGLLVGLIPLIAEIQYIGSVTYKLAKIATGISDLYVTVRPKNEWDFCAGDLILREAGGVLWDKAGQTIKYNKKRVGQPTGLFAGNPTLVKQIINRYSREPIYL